MQKDLFKLPPNLPVPQDDGACDHLLDVELTPIALRSTQGRTVQLSEIAKKSAVFFFYPRTGEPHVPTPEGWDLIPGARGCTPQSCGFRDLYKDFKNLGYEVFAISTQTTEYQQEFVSRNHIQFEILSDANFQLTDHLNLPTFTFGGARLIKRMAWVVSDGKIEKVFYPVFPPNENASQVLSWLKNQHEVPSTK